MVMAVKTITKPGDYGILHEYGVDRVNQYGLVIDVWTDNPLDAVTFRSVELPNTFVPLIIMGNCPVYIDDYYANQFGGDAANIRGSNTTILNYNVEGSTPVRPYMNVEVRKGETPEAAMYREGLQVYDPTLLRTIVYNGKVVIPGYHVDALQMYATSQGKYHSTVDDTLSNIYIPKVNIYMGEDKQQGISLTELCVYDNIVLGNEKLNIQVGYYYSLMATNLNNFVLGNPDDLGKVTVNKPIRLQNPKQTDKEYGYNNGVIAITHSDNKLPNSTEANKLKIIT